jgi:hypothetical protein
MNKDKGNSFSNGLRAGDIDASQTLPVVHPPEHCTCIWCLDGHK